MIELWSQRTMYIIYIKTRINSTHALKNYIIQVNFIRLDRWTSKPRFRFIIESRPSSGIQDKEVAVWAKLHPWMIFKRYFFVHYSELNKKKNVLFQCIEIYTHNTVYICSRISLLKLLLFNLHFYEYYKLLQLHIFCLASSFFYSYKHTLMIDPYI